VLASSASSQAAAPIGPVAGSCVLGPDESEVAQVKGGHIGQLQPFRDRDDRGLTAPGGSSA